MLLKVLRAKIQRATVTATAPDYVGSITIDMDPADEVGFVPGEFVRVGDLVIIMAHAYVTPEQARSIKPAVVVVDENNRVIKRL
ncbi:MAG: aspartate 1-decarboxylase [Phycisphaerae bacterium]|nr:aspartate 1-decarboxylase [Phycisphaerae bacterium]